MDSLAGNSKHYSRMKHVVEAGTDAASLLLFDPHTLPEEFDAANRDGDPTEILNDLHDQGRLF